VRAGGQALFGRAHRIAPGHPEPAHDECPLLAFRDEGVVRIDSDVVIRVDADGALDQAQMPHPVSGDCLQALVQRPHSFREIAMLSTSHDVAGKTFKREHGQRAFR
jgi:hypothetical protein